MAKEALELVIGKALLEASFRAALLADPDQALAGFDLTKAEKAAIRHLDGETLDSLAASLQEQKMKLHLAEVW